MFFFSFSLEVLPLFFYDSLYYPFSFFLNVIFFPLLTLPLVVMECLSALFLLPVRLLRETHFARSCANGFSLFPSWMSPPPQPPPPLSCFPSHPATQHFAYNLPIAETLLFSNKRDAPESLVPHVQGPVVLSRAPFFDWEGSQSFA